jgi:hypothetical protein
MFRVLMSTAMLRTMPDKASWGKKCLTLLIRKGGFENDIRGMILGRMEKLAHGAAA